MRHEPIEKARKDPLVIDDRMLERLGNARKGATIVRRDTNLFCQGHKRTPYICDSESTVIDMDELVFGCSHDASTAVSFVHPAIYPSKKVIHSLPRVDGFSRE